MSCIDNSFLTKKLEKHTLKYSASIGTDKKKNFQITWNILVSFSTLDLKAIPTTFGKDYETVA